MLFQNRKGLSRNTIISIIILTISFFMIFQLIGLTFDSIDEEASEKACRTSVKVRMDIVLRTEIAGVPVQSRPMVPIMCKTTDKGKLEGNEEEVKKQIADLTAKCWYMFLNGEYLNLFNKLDLLYGRNRCFICYTFSIDNKEISITRDEFIDYMVNTPYPYVIENLELGDEEEKEKEKKLISYLDYIQSYKGEGAVIINKDEKFTFKKGESYAIAFLSPDYGGDVPLVPDQVDTGTLNTLWNAIGNYLDFSISEEERKKDIRYPFINKIVIDKLNLIKEKGKCTAFIESK